MTGMALADKHILHQKHYISTPRRTKTHMKKPLSGTFVITQVTLKIILSRNQFLRGFLYLCCDNDDSCFAMRLHSSQFIYYHGFGTPSSQACIAFLKNNPLFRYVFIPCNPTKSHQVYDFFNNKYML